MSGFDYDVAIIGSGPAGIAAATGLSRAGISNIVVFERETDIGGIPRHTHHPSFGFLVFKRPMSGPQFVKKLLKRCPNVKFETSTTVLKLGQNGSIELASKDGIKTVTARHIILATGARESPRHSRLVSGLRPQSVMTTGALQQYIYRYNLKPFTRPVIIGTELVSFSAIWTLRHTGIKPVAMIEEQSRITAYWPATLFARLLGVKIYYNSEVSDIGKAATMSHVEIKNRSGDKQTIACDGVIFSGRFAGDNALARASHLTLSASTQIPLMDQDWLSSDPNISVIGNTAHPADMGDQCYLEGLAKGRSVAKMLSERADAKADLIPIRHDDGIKMTTPNMLRVAPGKTLNFDIALHVEAAYSGPITVKYNGKTIYQKTRNCHPARRIKLKNIQLNIGKPADITPILLTLGAG